MLGHAVINELEFGREGREWFAYFAASRPDNSTVRSCGLPNWT